MALLVKTDLNVSVVNPKSETGFTLQELHDLIGGYFEVVSEIRKGVHCFCMNNDRTIVYEVDRNTVMLLDEEGKLKNKPVNVIASELTDYKYGMICGDAVLLLHPEEIT